MLEDFGFLGRREQRAEINVGPLLDMVFILLIFFVITTNFTRQTGVEVHKPKAQSALYRGNEQLLIGISRDGAFHIHGKQVSPRVLEQLLVRESSRRSDPEAIIVGDRQSPLGKTVEVMDICARAGIHRVSVAADQR